MKPIPPRYKLTQTEHIDGFEADKFKQAVELAERMLETGHNRAVTITDTRAHKNKPRQYRVTVCDGSAHANPYIDHCGVCMPRWGIVVKAVEPNKESSNG